MNSVAEVHHEVQQIQRNVIAPSATPADLLRIAVESGADLDRLERLMELQARWEANEARKAFTVAMTAFKAEPIQIFKRKEVNFKTRDGDTTNYMHAELSDVTEAIGPAMAKHQLSFRWDIKQGNGAITVDCIVTHVLGHSEMVTMVAPPDASGKKNVIQQAASTVTYLQRYTLLAATGMSTKGMDDDGGGHGAGARAEAPADHIDIEPMIAAALATTSDAEALSYWSKNNGLLAKQRTDHARLKKVIAAHRMKLRATAVGKPLPAEA